MAKKRRVKRARNEAGFNNFEKALLESTEPTTRDFEIPLTFLWAVNAKLPIRER